ncbi:DUF2795 domain-containing protein [Streptomyces noursei]|uniref:DUF2795 domain-containing protein n=1 Tax=Streptomyces noursei TaxID=1971 RepID=UPI0033C44031
MPEKNNPRAELNSIYGTVDLGTEHAPDLRLVKKWPATKQDIIAAAKSAGSPKQGIAALERLPKDAYQDAKTLMKDLR